jgi:hypothetical protein
MLLGIAHSWLLLMSVSFCCAAAAKELMLADQYLALKEKGTLTPFMAKRRKQNAAKDHRYVSAASMLLIKPTACSCAERWMSC